MWCKITCSRFFMLYMYLFHYHLGANCALAAGLPVFSQGLPNSRGWKSGLSDSKCKWKYCIASEWDIVIASVCLSIRPPLCYLLLNYWTKSYQIWCVSYSQEWGVQQQDFFCPAPCGPGEGQKVTNKTYISNLNFILSPGSCPRGGTGALGCSGGQKNFFDHGHVVYQIDWVLSFSKCKLNFTLRSNWWPYEVKR